LDLDLKIALPRNSAIESLMEDSPNPTVRLAYRKCVLGKNAAYTLSPDGKIEPEALQEMKSGEAAHAGSNNYLLIGNFTQLT